MKRVITSIIVIIAIIVMGLIIFVLVGKGRDILSAANNQTTDTTLLQIQTKVKKIEVNSEMQKDTNLLKGQKFADCTEKYAQDLKEQGKILETDPNYKHYYIWDQSVLDELNLNIKLETGEIYIVNYITNIVIKVNTSDTDGDIDIYSTNDIKL